jgi:BirA family biotin operon repressor/biotin-[acetyl-CoA-carboxylase] ligase
MQVSDLSPASVSQALRTARYGRSLRVLAETDSTNDDARADAEAGASGGHLVLADRQRRGRGSQGRAWSSPAGTDLYFSIVERARLEPSRLPPLTLAVGVGVAEAVEALVRRGGRTRVKWPNDVWLDDRKCAGILVEAAAAPGEKQTAIIGIGLNVNRLSWPEEIRQTATSLCQATGVVFDRATVLARTLQAVEQWVDGFVADGPRPVVAALRERLALRGRRVSCGAVSGILLDVADSGAAVIETDAGPQEVIFGTLIPA